MIKLTRLNGKSLVINAEKILYVEETPDTMITLDNRDRIMVKEGLDDVIGKTVEYIRSARLFRVD